MASLRKRPIAAFSLSTPSTLGVSEEKFRDKKSEGSLNYRKRKASPRFFGFFPLQKRTSEYEQ